MKKILLASIAAVALGGFAYADPAGGSPNGGGQGKGLGNNTADDVSQQDLGFGSQDFFGSNAEMKNPQKGFTSDIGEGRERADEVNGKGRGWAN